jgi:hypothetical protein
MVHDDEKLVFDKECERTLNNAWLIICKLQEVQPDRQIASAAYRLALIEYSKPFKKTRGHGDKRYCMHALSLGETDLSLHKIILDLRDQYLAHCDIGVKDALVYRGKNGEEPVIVENTDAALPAMAAVRGLIERSLEILYARTPMSSPPQDRDARTT